MTDKVFDLDGKKIWVAGHRGMVGSAIHRALQARGATDIVTATSAEVDLTDQARTRAFVSEHKPEAAIIAAAKVGGILANSSAQADFLYENLMISANTVKACVDAGVEKVAILGSSCIYPKESAQPIREDYLMTGPLEPTNEGYAVAKIAALELGKMYRRQYGADIISLMPTNLYGPGDNYDLQTSHVLPALLRKTHEAKVADDASIELWGSGKPRREFLYVDDLADAVLFAIEHYTGEEHLNIGAGEDISIHHLAELIGEVVGWTGDYVLDTSKPDGTMRKLLDVSRMTNLGWSASTSLRDGLQLTYQSFLEESQSAVAPG